MANSDGTFGGMLNEALGGDTVEVIKIIDTPMEDKEISKELKFETSKVRVILNDLLAKNLVHLDRDRQDTGYCYYRWVRREDKIKAYLNSYVESKIKELDGMLSDEDEIIFECGCNRFDYGKAIELGFTCPECGRKLSHSSAGKGSRKIKDEMKKLQAIKNAS
jgi:transcription initiation factor TFIIE subunit alpha